MHALPRPAAPDLLLIRPHGGALPAAAQAAIAARGWTVADRGAAPDEGDAGGPALPVLLWSPQGWEAVLRAVHRLPAALCRRALLAAPGPAPADLGHRVRAATALSYWMAPWGGWLLGLAQAALARDAVEPGAAVLDQLRVQAAEQPEAFLLSLGAIAQTLLGADELEAVVQSEGGPPRVLQAGEGGVERVDRALAGDHTPPHEVVDKALLWDQVVVVPDLRHARAVRGGDAWGAALGLPIHQEPAGQPGPPAAALALYWREPRLPTPRELGLARILAVAAEASWARLVERDRLTRSHIDSLEALTQLPWAQGAALHEATVEQDEVALFIRRTLRSRSGLPRLSAFFANPSTSSRGAGSWVVIAPGGEERHATPGEAAALAGAAAGGHDCVVPRENGDWWHVLRIGSGTGGRALGHLVAAFPDRAAARAGRPDLRRLGADLAVGLRLLRRSSDTAALVELAQLLSDPTEPAPTLARMAGLLQRQLSADGVAVWVLGDPARPRSLERLHPDPTAAAVLPPGLVDWVLDHEDTLCVAAGPPEAAGAPGPWVGRDSRGRPVALPLPPPAAPGPGALVLVPLFHQGGLAGVLAAWRGDAAAFDPVLDIETMAAFAPHVVSACARVKAMARTAGELAAITHLARSLRPSTPLAQADGLVLRAVLSLCGAHLALLLRQDPDHPHSLAVAALAETGTGSARLRAELTGRLAELGAEPAHWPARAAAWVAGPEGGRSRERHLAHTVLLPGGDGGPPRGLVLFVFLRDRPAPVSLFADAATWRAVDTFVHTAGVLLAKHVDVHASALVDSCARAAGADPVQRAAVTLGQVLPGVEVVASRGGGRRQHITWAGPALAGLVGQVVDASDLARAPRPQVVREPDLEATVSRTRRAFDARLIARVKDHCGWRRLRSWMGVPIVHGNHLIGLIQLFTPEGGRVLGADHARVARTLAGWAAEEVLKTERQQMLVDLNAIATELAGAPPAAVEQRLGPAVQEWARRYLHRAVTVAILARSGPDHPLVRSAGGGIEDAELEGLAAFSIAAAGTGRRWSKGAREAAGLAAVSGRLAGVAAPLHLASGSSLQGHLVVLHPRDFDEADQPIIAEAARELSVLLHGEVVRHEWKLQAGLFRHALLGPVQGLQSAAAYLHALAGAEGSPRSELDRARDQIALESETLRLWRETQRIYTMVQDGQEPDIRRRQVALRPLVQRCIDRYAGSMRTRDIRLRLDWPPTGALQVELDPAAVDLVLSNLLDNARKYTFFHRSVTVGVAVKPDEIWLHVENIGREIPDELGDDIYEAGIRREGRDPVRAIAGEGLGLYLARALARAHGGELVHECEALTARRDEKTPHRVRFTLRLPHHWSRPARRGG